MRFYLHESDNAILTEDDAGCYRARPIGSERRLFPPISKAHVENKALMELYQLGSQPTVVIIVRAAFLYEVSNSQAPLLLKSQ